MSTIDVRIPAIGGFKDVGVIDLFVKPGDTVKVDESLLTLESDKATMDVPSPFAGTVKELKVKLGDRVSEGTIILTLDTPDGLVVPDGSPVQREVRAPESASSVPSLAPSSPRATGAEGQPLVTHASPSVRKVARELGVDLARVRGTGPHGRILSTDVQRFVKQVMAGAPGGMAGGITRGGTLDLLPWPQIDFASFGPIETHPLARIQKISGANLARNWVMIPHVTQFDEADITELEAFRVQLNEENGQAGVKVTLLAFLVKASVVALKQFPEFNASLDGDRLVRKRYFHIGFAADTSGGLVVPVLRNADEKGVLEIAKELGTLSAKAREGKLSPAQMQGGCFTISSLGGIGGTAFTPIINAPEVAILGVSRSAMKPVWDGKQFTPRRRLPISLSYDHRVIDGASAARFTTYLTQLLADMRRVVL